jgi:hypothetical protein
MNLALKERSGTFFETITLFHNVVGTCTNEILNNAVNCTPPFNRFVGF